MSYASLIDSTEFRTVRRYLNAAPSPIRGALFVASRDLLAQVAEQLEQPTQTSRPNSLLERWFSEGILRPAWQGEDSPETTTNRISLNRVHDQDSCDVLYLPPLYLVYVPGLVPHPEGRQSRDRTSALSRRREAV